MDKSELRAFEHYRLTGSRELFASASCWGCYLECVDILRQENINFEELDGKIQWLKKNDSSLSKTLSLRKALRQYDLGNDRIFAKLDKMLKIQAWPRPDVRYENEIQNDDDSNQVDVSKYFKFIDKVQVKQVNLTLVGLYQIEFDTIPEKIFWQMVAKLKQEEYRIPKLRSRLIREVIANHEKLDSINLDYLTTDEMQEIYKNSPKIQKNRKFVLALMKKLFQKRIKQTKKKELSDKLALLLEMQNFVEQLDKSFIELKLLMKVQIYSLYFKQGQLTVEQMIELMNSLTTEKQNPQKPKLASRNVRNIRRSFSNSGSADSFNEIDSDSDISFDDDVISPADNNQPKRKLKSFSDTPDWLELVDSLVNTLPKVIQYFIMQNDTIEPFDDYFPRDGLKQSYVKNKILSGTPISEIKYEVPQNFIQELMKKVEIEPKKCNQQYFERGDQVSVTLRVKNVEELIIRVYQINPITYYKSMKCQLVTDISLIGLQPQFEQIHNYHVQPNLRHIETFQFPELSNYSGVFVIDFLGNGRHTRTMINKGQVRHLSYLTTQGQKIQILDENNQVCRSPGTGVILDGEFYKPHEDGFVLLPFSRQGMPRPLIITDGEVSSLIENFVLQQESYNLTATVAINHESIVFGNRADVVIYPRLEMQGIQSELNKLQEFVVDVTLVDFSGNSVYKNFPIDVVGEEIVVQIDVPNQLTRIAVQLSAKVKCVSITELQQLRYSYNYETNKGSQNMSNMYLIYNTQGDSYLKMIGKSGEVWANKSVDLSITTVFQQKQFNYKLKTNQLGLIMLGDLSCVSTLRSNYKNDTQIWDIQTYRDQQTLPKTLDLCEGDQYKIPAFGNNLIQLESRVQLLKLGNKSTNWQLLSDLTQQLKIDNQENYVLPNLTKGAYLMYFPGMPQNILIRVHDGIHYDNNNFILAPQKSLETPNQYKTIRIQQITQQNNDIQVKIAGDVKNVRILVLGYNYITSSQTQIYNQFTNQRQRFVCSEEKLYKAESIYLKSKAIDEEYQYVLQRRNIRNMIGNSLPKPQLILNRLFTKDTESKTRAADKGEALVSKQMASRARKGIQRDTMRKMQNQASNEERSEDFLVHPGFILFNIQCNANGEAQFSIKDIEQFNSVQVIAFNSQDLAMKFYSLSSMSSQTRSITLKQPLDIQQTYSITRNSNVLLFNQQFTVEDLTSTKVKVIESLSTLFDSLMLILNNSEWQQFKFLCNWASFSQDRKLKFYNDYQCHEVDIFLYFKDRPFFNQYVAEFISNRIYKSFVDKWLLGDDLAEYLEVSALEKLNWLEKVLLIQKYYIYDSELCQSIIKSAEVQLYMERFSGQKALFNRRFDSVLSSKAVEGFQAQSLIKADVYCNAAPRQRMMKRQLSGRQLSRSASCSDSMLSCDEDMDSDLEASMVMDFKESKKKKFAKSRAPNQYFEQTGCAKEYMETYWYKTSNEENNQQINKFWLEVLQASAQGETQILSTSFLETNQVNLSTFIGILTFFNLPSAPNPPQIQSFGSGIKYTAQTPLLVLYKTQGIVPFNPSSEIVLGQRCYEADDSQRKNVTNFLSQTLYVCELSIVNICNQDKDLAIMFQIPQGSVPIDPAQSLVEKTLTLNQNTNVVFNYFFYFPNSGTFRQYPPTAAFEGEVISKGVAQEYKVVDFYDLNYFQTFRDVAASGNVQNIINYLNERIGSEDITFSDCYWLLENKEFYEQILLFFRSIGRYDQIVWSYSIKHKDESTLKQYFKLNSLLTDYIGPYFTSKLISTGKGNLKQLEYDPIVNPRVHKLGNHTGITNTTFQEVYFAYVKNICQKLELDDNDRMQWIQYLLYQDRQYEAFQLFQQINMTPSQEQRGTGRLQLQYDYLACYFDLQNAIKIATLYENYHIRSWQNRFKKVIEILSEKQETQAITQESALQVKTFDNKLELSYSNVSEITIKYHIIDLEIIFSRFPFSNQGMEGLGWVQPSQEDHVSIDPNLHLKQLDIPEQLQDKCMMIEIDYGQRSVSTIYFSSRLKTYVDEKYGEIIVCHQNGQPLGGVYIKVFSQYRNGKTDYYKDGYTDTGK